MKVIAINLYFQLQLSSEFLCSSIPLGALYFNGLKFSSFPNSGEKFISPSILAYEVTFVLVSLLESIFQFYRTS